MSNYLEIRDTLTEEELDKYRHLKTIKSTSKLNAMMPAWIKKHMRDVAMPKYQPFIPNQAPKFPAYTNVPKFGCYAEQKRLIPSEHIKYSVSEYIQEFIKLNKLCYK